ncbi:Cytochrome P450 71C4 [Hordeum vulgare]|nr:Cytochrome P450 71C4 [Hordeum vulgare]
MGLFSGAGSSKIKGKSPAIPFPSEFIPPPLAPARRPRQRVNVPVHQAEWHWQHRVPLPYPDATLPHDWHLEPERIPVSAAPWSAKAHAEEVRRWRALLTLKQRRDPVYATDAPKWARWFVFEHEEARRCGVCEVDSTMPLHLQRARPRRHIPHPT